MGRLAKTAVDNTLVERTIGFLWDSLLPWRDDPEREYVEGEEDLNAQFQNFIQVRARDLFPMIHFQHEQRQTERRRVDIAAKPTKATTIDGITYTKYQPFLVIEGKRLPAPSKDREQEYVTGGAKRSGGIQRFKLGLHGKDHTTAIIVGYVQRQNARHWYSQVNSWISDLAKVEPQQWGADEMLAEFATADKGSRSRAVSNHIRSETNIIAPIRLFHFWIQCSNPLP